MERLALNRVLVTRSRACAGWRPGAPVRAPRSHSPNLREGHPCLGAINEYMAVENAADLARCRELLHTLTLPLNLVANSDFAWVVSQQVLGESPLQEFTDDGEAPELA